MHANASVGTREDEQTNVWHRNTHRRTHDLEKTNSHSEGDEADDFTDEIAVGPEIAIADVNPVEVSAISVNSSMIEEAGEKSRQKQLQH